MEEDVFGHYKRTATLPAGFSKIWVQELLRKRWRYQGAVFTDDLTMAAASVAGDIGDRVDAALAAGCDMALICNHPEWVDQLLIRKKFTVDPLREVRLTHLLGHGPILSPNRFQHDPRTATAKAWVERLQNESFGDERAALDDGWFLNEE